MERFFPRIDSLEDAQKALRTGGIAGLIISGMIVLGGIFLYFSGSIPGQETYETSEDRMYALIGVGLELLLVAFLTWRLWAGHGYVSGVILLAIFLLESVLKVLGSISNAVWVIFYIGIAIMLFNGIRAAFAYKRVTSADVTTEAF